MKLFDYDGPLMRALVYLGDLILLNVLFLLCCVPVVTAGASAAALYTVTFRTLDDKGGHVCRQFFTAFGANFKKATLEWLVMLAVAGLLYADFCIITQTAFAGKAVIEVAFVLVLSLYLPTLTFLFPLQAYYENTVAKTLKNAVALGIAKLPQSVLLIALYGVPLVLLYFDIGVFFRLLPVWLIVGYALSAQLAARLLRRIFRKLS